MTADRLEAYKRFKLAAGNRRHMLREEAYASLVDAAEGLLLARDGKEARAAREEAASILLRESGDAGALADVAEMLWLALRPCGPAESWPSLRFAAERPVASLSSP